MGQISGLSIQATPAYSMNQSSGNSQNTGTSQSAGGSQSQGYGQSTGMNQSSSSNSTGMVGGMLDVYNQLLGVNQQRYGNVLGAYNQGQSTIQKYAPELYNKYDQVGADVGNTLGMGQVLGKNGNWGVAQPAATAIGQAATAQRGATTQQMTNAGLGNTTAVGNAQAQNSMQEQQAYGSLGAQLAQTAAGYQSQLGQAQIQTGMQGLGMSTGLTQGALGPLGSQLSNTAGTLTGGFGSSQSVGQNQSTNQNSSDSWNNSFSQNQGTSQNQGYGYSMGSMQMSPSSMGGAMGQNTNNPYMSTSGAGGQAPQYGQYTVPQGQSYATAAQANNPTTYGGGNQVYGYNPNGGITAGLGYGQNGGYNSGMGGNLLPPSQGGLIQGGVGGINQGVGPGNMPANPLAGGFGGGVAAPGQGGNVFQNGEFQPGGNGMIGPNPLAGGGFAAPGQVRPGGNGTIGSYVGINPSDPNTWIDEYGNIVDNNSQIVGTVGHA